MSVFRHTHIAASLSCLTSSLLLCYTGFNVATTRTVKLQASKNTATSPEQEREYKTKVSCNGNMAKLQAGYLFPEIGRRKAAHMLKYPDAHVISLGIGNTTEPISEVITSAMAKRALELSTVEGYNVDGAEQGEKVLFGSNVTMAVQDPSYPAYVDSSVIMGQTGQFEKDVEKFSNIEYMKCIPENDFFPDLSKVSRTDMIYFCSPNNPAGSAASREQLIQLVKFAKKNGSIIIYDSAYSMYISGNTPKSIFEIPKAKEVAIEMSSFSKYSGFGVRLGWTVVPKELKFSDGFPVAKDFHRIVSTGFNGASNIDQAGGIACLSSQGLEAMQEVVGFYKENARIIVHTFTSLGFNVYGGIHAPYLWVYFPGRSSWEIFNEILEKTNVVTIPGIGFGPAGEGFIRISAFGHQANVLEACRRFKELYQ
ncbi:LL-diaminopimelate aminotransferase, chloroplastic [Artemisia annua]|uniref:LL-diaminopimelate aminotransferase, chloroplastic n=1 Tax=Artemisia annua TaxID=35608 RepID=A0A2U1Q3S6_ARTAN|nr:LL-diaminopimelate aminotransferase, chloroplastic [Artemisia annua]